MSLVALKIYRKKESLFNVLPFVLKLGSCAKSRFSTFVYVQIRFLVPFMLSKYWIKYKNMMSDVFVSLCPSPLIWL